MQKKANKVQQLLVMEELEPIAEGGGGATWEVSATALTTNCN